MAASVRSPRRVTRRLGFVNASRLSKDRGNLTNSHYNTTVDAAPQPERYEILSKIGQGGIGAVYRAQDRALRREVAIKRLLPQGDKPEEERHTNEELVREASLLSKLQHPNIVTVYDAGIDDDGVFIVMELIDGETLDDLIERGALTFEDFKSVAEQALEGLIAAQEIDMLHRDLKPSNVMISWLPSGRFELKLLDFGLAKVTQKPSTQTVQWGDAILGSIYFMAPEQFEREPLDGRTDLYSLGCLFYYALAGAYPFDGEHGAQVMAKKLEHQVAHLCSVRPDVPQPIGDWVMRLMARSRDDRPATAKQALDEFVESLARSPAAPTLAPVPIPVIPPRYSTPPGAITTSMVAAGPGLRTTTHHMAPPQGSNKKQTAVAAVATFSILAAVAAGAYFFLKPKDDSSDKGDSSDYEFYAPPPVADNPEHNVSIVSLGSKWHYWDRGGSPPDGWVGLSFDSSAWGSGKAPLGYGEKSGITTEIGFGDDPKQKHISSFFRYSFNSKGGDFDSLQLRYQVDDGCIIYLNGEEVARHSMGSAPSPDIDQLASPTASGAAETTLHSLVIGAESIRKGDNTIAVRVHQSNASSSDLRFDLELKGAR
jgi:serine/threonine protein kinase